MGAPEHPHADWLDRHRFYSVGHLVEQLMSLFQHDTDNDGQIVIYTDYAEAPEGVVEQGNDPGVLALKALGETPCECDECLDGDPVAIREHALHQLNVTVADPAWAEEQVTEALAEVLDQIEANGGRLFPDAVEEGLSNG